MIVIFYDFVLLTHYEYFYGGVNWLDKKVNWLDKKVLA